MHATTNEKYCPTLKDKISDTELFEDSNGVYEIVFDAIDEEKINIATQAAINAIKTIPDVQKVSAGNFGGKLTAVKTDPATFAPNLEGLEKAISPATKVVLINSPNNPTGAVYTLDELKGVAELLTKKSQEIGHPIWLVSDEPYRFLAYDGVEVPSILPLYPYSICVSSFSKNLSLPGERIGYAAVSPDLPEKETVMAALTMTNRILGYVNPPVIGQQIMKYALGSHVDKSFYEKRRLAMAQVLTEAGYQFLMPKGAFYFFPQAPGGDDVAFVNALAKELVLAVPGSGFGYPGFFRLAFCVDEKVILAAKDGFIRAREAIEKDILATQEFFNCWWPKISWATYK